MKQNNKIYDPLCLRYTQVFDDEEMYEIEAGDQYARDKAKALGLTLVESDDNTLLLDFDTEVQWANFTDRLLPLFLDHRDVDRVWWTESKSGNKRVFVKLTEPLVLRERILLQVMLGSDNVREMLALANEADGRKLVSIFYEKPDAVQHVIYATDGYQPLLDEPLQPLLLTDGDLDQELTDADVTFDVEDFLAV